MNYKLIRYSLSLLLAVAFCQLAAQNEIAHIYGQLKDQTTKKKLEGCLVQAFKDGATFDSYDAGTSGKYDFKLPLGFVYDVKFSKADYLSKIIRIDTRNIPQEEKAGGFDMNVDGTLFPSRPGFNTDLLKEPMAKAVYDPKGDGLGFDFGYSERKQKEIDAEFKRLDDIEKNFAKLKADFDQYIKEGDQAMIEKKYGDAVGKYKSGLAIFPLDAPAKVKLADAQAKLDAENEGKDQEAKYKKLIEDGDVAFKDNKYEGAKKNYQDAVKIKPEQKYPKEQLYQIELAMADAKRRGEYDAILADADKKFKNDDFAVSIEKYKEASTMYPTESYPKDQILKAEAALKDMLAYEAERLRLEKEYNDKIALAERSVLEDKLDQAISHYKTASGLKPGEQMPKDKIAELEALIISRNAMNEMNTANASANAERDRIEKEFNDLVDAGDQLFIKEQLLDAKSKFEASLLVKPEAQYPKSKIQTIDMLLAQQEELKSVSASKAIQDSLDAANNAALAAANERTRLALEQERLDTERRQQELEEQRLAAEQKLKARKRNWDTNVDKVAEDQVENYYREAAKKEYAAKNDKVQQQKEEFIGFYAKKADEADALVAINVASIKTARENQNELASIGTSIQNASIADNDRKKKDVNKDRSDYQKMADSRIIENEQKIESSKEALKSVGDNDRNRVVRVSENESTKERVQKNNETYARKGDTQRAENKMKADNEKKKFETMSFDGELVRKNNEDKVKSRMHNEQTREKDEKKAADQRIINSKISIDRKKSDAESRDDGKELPAYKKAKDIEIQKVDSEFEERQRESRSANGRHESRKTAFNKKTGEPKSEEEFLPVPGTEQLREGVTENSYKLGNKMVTERIVKIGNKVDKYKKVVSKTAIYYFCNGQSITEVNWRQATLSEPD